MHKIREGNYKLGTDFEKLLLIIKIKLQFSEYWLTAVSGELLRKAKGLIIKTLQMKSKFLVFFFVLLGYALSAQTAPKQIAFDAIASGDVEALINYFDHHVELCFNDQIQVLDKQAASKAIRSFFEKNPPKSCAPIHGGVSKNNSSQYKIGSLTSTNGKNFRVFVYTEEEAGKKVIKELRIMNVN